MANATIQFSKTNEYIVVPGNRVQLTLLSTPPAGASLGISAYSSALGQDSGFRNIGHAVIDSLSSKPAMPQYVIPIGPGVSYAFQLEGNARLLLPGYHSLTVGLLLTDASGKLIHDFGSQCVGATHALLDGLFYVRTG